MRVSMETLVSALRTIRSMDEEEIKRAIRTIAAEQPNLFSSVLEAHRMGVSEEDTEFLLELLHLVFEAMKQSPYDWEVISEEEIDGYMDTIVDEARTFESLDPKSRSDHTRKLASSHPEQPTYAFVICELKQLCKRSNGPQETYKYVAMCALGFVHAVARGTLKARSS